MKKERKKIKGGGGAGHEKNRMDRWVDE
jgi:hypothetical protein